jgi:hypothetical protein
MSDTAVVVVTFVVSYGLIGAYAIYLHLQSRKAGKG